MCEGTLLAWLLLADKPISNNDPTTLRQYCLQFAQRSGTDEELQKQLNQDRYHFGKMDPSCKLPRSLYLVRGIAAASGFNPKDYRHTMCECGHVYLEDSEVSS